MSNINYFEVLGIVPGTSVKEIKKKYKKLIKEIHPDLHQNKSEEELAELNEKVALLNTAYEWAIKSPNGVPDDTSNFYDEVMRNLKNIKISSWSELIREYPEIYGEIIEYKSVFEV